MKKNYLLVTIVAFIAVVLFTGCKKWVDKYFPGHGNHGKKSCRIMKIQQGLPGLPETSRTGWFYYSQGRLDSVIFDISTGSAGAQFHYFMYNNAGKLTEYRADYSREEGDYYFWHTYVWEGGKITIDTARVREAGSFTNVTYPEYDNKGRVIKETGFNVEADGNPTNTPLDDVMYEYGDDGNLVVDDPTYDDKTNYLRTNDVLMFVHRNYNKNNYQEANEYNEEGLPVAFPDEAKGGFLQWGTPTHIEYQCK